MQKRHEAQRIVFEFKNRPESDREHWAQVTRLLSASDGQLLPRPKVGPPLIFVAVLPNKVIAQKVIKQLRDVEGVLSADLDTLARAV